LQIDFDSFAAGERHVGRDGLAALADWLAFINGIDRSVADMS
jgi:hypothetical protein